MYRLTTSVIFVLLVAIFHYIIESLVRYFGAGTMMLIGVILVMGLISFEIKHEE